MTGKLIGLAGHAGSGKDFVYDLLTTEFSDIQRVAFADEVRFEVEDALNGGMPLYSVWDKPYSDEVRALLQWWGTEYRRNQDEMYWVNKARATIEEALEWADLVVVTDMRFINEAALIKYLGGMTVEVTASKSVRRRRLGGSLPPEHASEDIDFPIDVFITNNERPRMPQDLNEYIGLDKDFQFRGEVG